MKPFNLPPFVHPWMIWVFFVLWAVFYVWIVTRLIFRSDKLRLNLTSLCSLAISYVAWSYFALLYYPLPMSVKLSLYFITGGISAVYYAWYARHHWLFWEPRHDIVWVPVYFYRFFFSVVFPYTVLSFILWLVNPMWLHASLIYSARLIIKGFISGCYFGASIIYLIHFFRKRYKPIIKD